MALHFDPDVLEKELIISLIAQPQIIPEVAQITFPADFSNVKYKTFYEAILELSAENSPITKITLFKKVNDIGGSFTVEDVLLFEEDIPIDTPISLASTVMNLAVERDIRTLSDRIPKHIESEPDTLNVLGNIQEEALKLAVRLIGTGEKSYQETLDDAFESFESTEEVFENVIPTPWRQLNTYISGGWKENQLITVGARTGIGKTVVSTNCAVEACRRGHSVLMFTLEMTKKEILQRLVATRGNILLNQLNPGPWKSQRVLEKIRTVKEEMREWKLDIRDDSDITIETIRAICQQKKQSAQGLDFVIIDYLQLISTKGTKAKNRQEAVAEISRNCKMMAKSLKVPVMILVQLNREDKMESEERIPSKADIRESAAIAADSDIVLIIHRKYRDDSLDPKALFILDKNRKGPADKKFQVKCILEKNIFQDVEETVANEETEEEVQHIVSNDGWGNPNDMIEKEEVVEDDFSDLFGEEF